MAHSTQTLEKGAAKAAPAAAVYSIRRPRSATAKKMFPYLLVGPAVLYLLAITLYPGLFAMYQSLFVVKFVNWSWAGLGNYTRIIQDREFWAALANTAIIGGLSLSLQTIIAMTVAFYCYRDPFVRGWRIVFLMPMLFMPSAVAFIWKLAFNDGRVISDLLMAVGLVSNNVDWLSSVWLARLTLIVADVWQWTPFLFIIFVGALQGQDEEIEEAARLDGASWGSIFWNISLPMMRPIIVVAVTLRGIDITTMFTNVYIMTQGTPGGATETMSYFIYRQGFRMFNFGYASAASVLMLLITIVIAQTIVKRAFKSGKS
ncbi:carbohydrate ABC transporter permease [Sinorhizobium americanum]|uniref:Multiple sugar transport system permease protein n=1 Tax=Sinorhizobium americanum TaxID=194963 RepID=A0A4R2C355_9HYPH|nr:sugar ABC transporter permease [Sinorhizobium americanum]TCN34163.1 multiple sugar transport system permease protein [Sinorhizobium americanum]